MAKRGLRLVPGALLAAATALALAACGGASRPGDEAASATPQAPAPVGGATVIEMSGETVFVFVPEHVEIARGGSVTWTWVAGIHNVVGDGPIDHPEVVNEVGYSYTVAFADVGTYAFTCQVHPDDMNGTVTVR